jgi:uncharacterized protein
MMKPYEIFGADADRGWVPWALITPFLGLVFVVLPAFPASLELQRLGLLDAQEEPVGRLGLIALLLVPFGAMGVVVVVWSWLIERRSLASIGLVDGGAGSSLCFGLLVGALTSGGVVAAIWAAGGYQASAVAPAFASADALIYIAVLLACFVVQSGTEEIVFRGWMMSALARRINILGAIGIVSLVFTLLHMGRGTTLLAAGNTFLFSTFACCWALKARNIWGVMGWHAGWNWLVGTGFGVPVTGLDVQAPALVVRLTPIGPVDLTGGAHGPEGSVFCGLFFAAATALLIARGALSNRA